MMQKSFIELYQEAKSRPTPAQEFIAEIAKLTHRSEMTVRMWISGNQIPDELAQATIAKRYNVSVDSLFPRREEAQVI